MINIMMSGKEIDKSLKAINDAQNSEHNGKVLYIHNGELSFEDGEALFDLAEWEDE